MRRALPLMLACLITLASEAFAQPPRVHRAVDRAATRDDDSA